jgi:uncharacterized membrane protein
MTAQDIQRLTFPVIALLVLLLAATMVWRVYRHLRDRDRVPIILKRDVALFVTLAVLLAGGAYSRATGVSLAGEAWWVTLTNFLAIVTLVYWLAVEWGLIRQGERP